MGTDNSNNNEASGSDGNTPGTNTAVSETDFQQPATTAENFIVPASAVEPTPATLKCRAFPHGVYSVVISFWSGFAWLM